MAKKTAPKQKMARKKRLEDLKPKRNPRGGAETGHLFAKGDVMMEVFRKP